MTAECVLGLDIGTASSKAVLVDLEGRVIERAQQVHELSLPRPGFAEHDAEEVWWGDVRHLTSRLVPERGELRAVCVSGIGPCLLPCGTDLRPLRPAILYGIDSRATEEIGELTARYGEEAILSRGGSTLSSQAVGPKLLWLQHHEPEVWRQTRGWYTCHSFVVGRLTGEYVLDHHSASQCDPLYDLDHSDWAADWASEIAPGVPVPRLVWPGEIVGTVTASAAASTGIPAGTPVAAGTIDAWAESFSVGVRQPGELMLMYGSTMFFIGLVEQTLRNPALWCTKAVERDRSSVAAGTSTAGILTEWLRELVGNPSWESLLADTARVPVGAQGLLVLPYFAGERTPIYDPEARGLVAGLTLRHGPPELLRAIYEGIAFGARQILELFAEGGPQISRVVAVGGGVQGRLWPQIVSDVTGLEQEVPSETIGACYGDALLAAIAAGLVAEQTDWSRPAETLVPDRKSQPLYAELFELYSDLYPQTAATTHRLAQLSADNDE
jgi:xylulokinase